MGFDLNQDGSAARPQFAKEETFHYTQAPDTTWEPKSGASDDEWKSHAKIPIAVSDQLRENYRLLIGGITPRPIGFIATVDKNGNKNVAPFSFFNVNLSDPPIFSFGITGEKNTKDNILDTGELTINIISEWYIEAANFTAIDAPHGVDEFELSGLTPADSLLVKAPHVAEAAFSIEAKLVHHHQFYSKADPSLKTGSVFVVEGIQFHVREDVLDKERKTIDMAKYKPVSRIGGIGYSRTTTGYELKRPTFEEYQAYAQKDAK